MALYNDESNGASHPWRAVSYGNEHSAAVRVPAGVKSLGGENDDDDDNDGDDHSVALSNNAR